MEICRTIHVEIEKRRWGEDEGGEGADRLVRPERPPDDVLPAARYLAKLLPGHRMEHAGGAGIAQVTPDYTFGKFRLASNLFFQALSGSFARHYPFVIRPEVLMHLIVHEVATTVKQQPDDYRALFTKQSSGKRVISVRDDRLAPGRRSSPWDEAIAAFDPALRKVVPAGIMEHLLPTLSTATAETRAASLVGFMDAASPFYDYEVMTLCGVPEIRLAGVPQDYAKITAAAAQLAEVFDKHLRKYFRRLLPVLKTIAEQAAGARHDNEFWSSIYQDRSMSGSFAFGGWCLDFIHHVQTHSHRGITLAPRRDRRLEMTDIPSQVSVVPFVWKYLDRKLPMVFAGGVLGVDVIDGAVAPRLTYAVLHDPKE